MFPNPKTPKIYSVWTKARIPHPRGGMEDVEGWHVAAYMTRSAAERLASMIRSETLQAEVRRYPEGTPCDDSKS